MNTASTKIIPAGIKLLRYFYGLTAILCGLHLAFLYVYTDILWFGTPLSETGNLLVAFVLTLIPLLLFFGFRSLNRLVWRASFSYHLFFALNSLLGAIASLSEDFPLKPAIRITGKYSAQTPLTGEARLRLFTVFNLNLFMGMIILWYLWKKRGYFGGGGGKKNSVRKEVFG